MSLVIVHEYKADVNARDDNNDTPLHVAIMEKKEVDDAICMEHRLWYVNVGIQRVNSIPPPPPPNPVPLTTKSSTTQSIMMLYIRTFLFVSALWCRDTVLGQSAETQCWWLGHGVDHRI